MNTKREWKDNLAKTETRQRHTQQITSKWLFLTSSCSTFINIKKNEKILRWQKIWKDEGGVLGLRNVKGKGKRRRRRGRRGKGSSGHSLGNCCSKWNHISINQCPKRKLCKLWMSSFPFKGRRKKKPKKTQNNQAGKFQTSGLLKETPKIIFKSLFWSWLFGLVASDFCSIWSAEFWLQWQEHAEFFLPCLFWKWSRGKPQTTLLYL